MHALLLAAAFALTPQPPRVFVFSKPPDFVDPGELGVISMADRHRGSDLAKMRHIIEVLIFPGGYCSPISNFDVVHREGGFESGFGLFPPKPIPTMPEATAGFWSPFDSLFPPPKVDNGFGEFGGRGGLGGGGLGGFGGGFGGRRPLTSDERKR